MTEYKNIAIKVSPEEHRRIKRLSADTGKSIKDLVMECLERLIQEYEEQNNNK